MCVKTCHKVDEKMSITSDKNQKSIASGIVQVTAILANGASKDNCQKLNIITGREKASAESVNTKASLIASVSGRKKNIFFQKFWV